MKKRTIGFILTGSKRGREYQEEKIFKNLAREKGINFVSFNLDEEINEAEIERKSRQCSLVFNNTADEMAVELVKTIEFLGTKVIDSSKVFYYTEDKWMFFLKCQKHHLSVPKTILLSGNFHSAKKEMDNFGSWPLVLKRVQGERGDFVARANNSREGIEIIKTFWKKGNEKLPVIAQEFIDSPCYRVTMVGDKIVQTAVKLGRGWKKTGAYAEDFNRFKVDPKLSKIVKKLAKVCQIKVCGIDLLKKKDQWIILEVNAEPSFRFFEEEQKNIIGKVLDFLVKESQG